MRVRVRVCARVRVCVCVRESACACACARGTRKLPQTLVESVRSVIIMSNNNASSSVAVAQKTVKQLRLEVKVRRINVSMTASTVNLKEFSILRVYGRV